jgi:hypothetical protein
MSWAGNQHPFETLLEWGAPAMLAGASGWSAWSVGLGQGAAGAAAALALVSGRLVIRIAGKADTVVTPQFDPASFEADVAVADELLLDDPLIGIPDDSRVVRLFALQDATPGELVLRIEDFLDRRPPRDDAAAVQQIPDAGAALHSALANIRASLR